jgi:uncharacterized protein YjbJ (UPF0337 family)
MNWDRVEGQWKQQRGEVDHYFGKIMNDKMSTIMGKYDGLVGTLQMKYDNVKKGTLKQVDALKIIIDQMECR